MLLTKSCDLLSELEEVSELLGCSSSQLTKALTERVVNTGKDKVKADLSATEVCVPRPHSRGCIKGRALNFCTVCTLINYYVLKGLCKYKNYSNKKFGLDRCQSCHPPTFITKLERPINCSDTLSPNDRVAKIIMQVYTESYWQGSNAFY